MRRPGFVSKRATVIEEDGESGSTRVKKDLMSPPWTSTLGRVATMEGRNSWPLQTSLLPL